MESYTTQELGRHNEIHKYFETLEEYESWINIKENAEEVYRTEEKICVDGVILSHTYKEYEKEVNENDL